MKSQIVKSFAAAALATTVAAPAFADDMVDGSNPQAVLSVAQGWGEARLDVDGAGDPVVIGEISGTKYGIFFYGCSNGKNCSTLQFAATWSGANVSLSDVNQWNSGKLYGKASLDSDGDPAIKMVVNLEHGVSTANLDSTFNWWQIVLDGFKSEVLIK